MAHLSIQNATAHNLKGVNLTIPHHALTTVCGVSGSGKSTLVFDIIEKESKKRFFESLSAYARQKIGKMGRAQAERISGLLPVVALRQRIPAKSSRSRAGTLSGIDELLRLLFARFGVAQESEITLTRSLFSRNTPQGMCPRCRGWGEEEYIDPERIIQDRSKTLRERALRVTLKSGYTVYSQVTLENLNRVCTHHGFTVDTPLTELTPEQLKVLFYGSKEVQITYGKHTLESRMRWEGMVAKPPEQGFYRGLVPVMEEILRRDRNPNILKYCSSKTCGECLGSGLNRLARSVTYRGRPLHELNALPFTTLAAFLEGSTLGPGEEKVLSQLLKKLHQVLGLGLGYLSCGRSSATLSGGEAQRLQLVRALDVGLKNIMYILDEPSAGLHLRDRHTMIRLLFELVARGNTVVVVEHDRDTIDACNYLVEMGPGPGYLGGQVLYQGPRSGWPETPYHKELKRSAPRDLCTLTSVSASRREPDCFTLSPVTHRNLRGICPTLLRGSLNTVCGVSGSGKSSLVMEALPTQMKLQREAGYSRVVYLSNAPMGRTSRSNPATYTTLFSTIRSLFAREPLAKKRGFTATHFSFNTKGGRCETCAGQGYLELGLHFMENDRITCPACNGARFREEILEVTYRGKSVAQVLDLEVGEALELFHDTPKLKRGLGLLLELGLGYLKLGQPSQTLSGGEAQRVRLALELNKRTGRETLFLLDEPSRGLSVHEKELLLTSLRRLTKRGATVVAVEHDPTLLLGSDWIVELGPGGGEEGGDLLFQGGPGDFLRATTPTKTALVRPPLTPPPPALEQEHLQIRGAHTNTLQGITLSLPLNRLIVLSGGAGAGKTSLAVDTLHNEAWQRYAASLSGYVRRFLGNRPQAKVDALENLPPSLVLSGQGSNSRGTVATLCGLYDYLRLLFARFATYTCPTCRTPGGECGCHPLHPTTAALFSFNLNQGACPQCGGLGVAPRISLEHLLTDPQLSITGGLLGKTKPARFYSDPNGQYMATLKKVAECRGIPLGAPWHTLSPGQQRVILYGTGEERYQVDWRFQLKKGAGNHQFTTTWKGFVNLLQEDLLRNLHNKKRATFAPLEEQAICQACGGARLSQEVLSYRYMGLTIAQFTATTPSALEQLLAPVKGPQERLFVELRKKAHLLEASGLGYLTLDRAYDTLSSGEQQRLQIAGALGENLSGVLYVLDEPARGLRHQDTQYIVENCRALQRQGNTVLLVDPKERFYDDADELVVLSQGAVAYQGAPAGYPRTHAVPPPFRAPNTYFHIKNANLHNLKGIDVPLGYGTLNVVHGISGSGKTSLVFGVLGASFGGRPVGCDALEAPFPRLIQCRGSAWPRTQRIGRSLGITPLLLGAVAKAAGLPKKALVPKVLHCLFCSGSGKLQTNLELVAEVHYPCETCQGTGLSPWARTLSLQGIPLEQLLALSLEEVSPLITTPSIQSTLERACALGLGAVGLHQRGGELPLLQCQLLQIAQEAEEKSLILMDEPAGELAPREVLELLTLLEYLISEGHTLVVTEHDPLLIAAAGHCVELGPGSGPQGGTLVSITP